MFWCSGCCFSWKITEQWNRQRSKSHQRWLSSSFTFPPIWVCCASRHFRNVSSNLFDRRRQIFHHFVTMMKSDSRLKLSLGNQAPRHVSKALTTHAEEISQIDFPLVMSTVKFNTCMDEIIKSWSPASLLSTSQRTWNLCLTYLS